jgi:5-formyltetrahydrofolate cyclo-ligase
MKKVLRQTALAYRNQLSDDDISAHSQRISAHISTLLQTFSTCTVGLFYPVRGEPNLLDLAADAALKHVNWALPVCSDLPDGSSLRFARYCAGQKMEKGRYNIPVPETKAWVLPEILIIPCSAYYPDGSRLGYGAGWYDRTLAAYPTRPLCLGIAYSATRTSGPFAEGHDCLLDYIITELEVLDCRPGTQ